ncbi:MAG: SDR family NAD(P)-dependent oxidoreductase [Reyranella sp.]|nr:SDR family NAD(P)-dependent oxidoreductase [Reyranella sp.]
MNVQLALKDRVLIVTGAAGHLGNAIADRFEKDGATVVSLDRAGSKSARPGRLQAVDLLDAEAVRITLAGVASRHGRIDALINVAGGFAWQTVSDGDPILWDELYRVNLRTAVVASQAVLPHLARPGGRIVNIGAAAAVKAGIGMAAYAASKAGVAKLTESLSEELKREAITVNAVLPSIIDTPANRADMPDADPTCWVPADHVAALIVFLLSPEAGSITGALIPVTGRV